MAHSLWCWTRPRTVYMRKRRCSACSWEPGVAEWAQGIAQGLAHFDLGSAVDILGGTLLFYWLLILIRGTAAEKMLLGVVILLGLGSLVGTFLNLTMLRWLVTNVGPF